MFDSNEHCVNELASGIDPFIADAVVECDEPVAILDDRFSGVMNICHFLLDRVTRLCNCMNASGRGRVSSS